MTEAQSEATTADPLAEAIPSHASNAHTPNAWGLVGHDRAVETFRRVIREGNLSHAYLITGPDGVGKGTLARRLAQTLASPTAADPTVPDLTTRAARQIEAGELADIERITIGGICDEASHDHQKDNSTRIRICQVRRIERVSSLAPFASPRRIFVIDTANQLQPEASHAILKTLEEPSANVLILMLSTDPDALLPTIRSRCQEVALRPMSYGALRSALEADPQVSDPATIARLAHGRYGLAMRMQADPTLAILRESVTHEIRRLARGTRNERFDVADRLSSAWSRDKDREAVLQTIELWRDWWRDVLIAASGANEPADADLSTGDTVEARAQVTPEAQQEANYCTPAEALRALLAVQTAREHLLANTNPQLVLEVMMLDLPVLGGPPPPPLGRAGARDKAEESEDSEAVTAPF